MSKEMFPHPTSDIAAARKELAPAVHDAFAAFSERVFAEGALPVKTKQLIAVAAAHITQCPYCIRGHVKAALRQEANRNRVTSRWSWCRSGPSPRTGTARPTTRPTGAAPAW